LPPDDLQRLFTALGRSFNIAPDAEVTMEANPSSLLPDYLGSYRALGINRISLGVQSLDEPALRFLGRAHSVVDSEQALRAVAAAGLVSWSADLIFGYPGQTSADVERMLRRLVEEFGAPHISCYHLTLHSGTPLERRFRDGRFHLPEDDDIVAMFQTIRERG